MSLKIVKKDKNKEIKKRLKQINRQALNLVLKKQEGKIILIIKMIDNMDQVDKKVQVKNIMKENKKICLMIKNIRGIGIIPIITIIMIIIIIKQADLEKRKANIEKTKIEKIEDTMKITEDMEEIDGIRIIEDTKVIEGTEDKEINGEEDGKHIMEIIIKKMIIIKEIKYLKIIKDRIEEITTIKIIPMKKLQTTNDMKGVIIEIIITKTKIIDKIMNKNNLKEKVKIEAKNRRNRQPFSMIIELIMINYDFMNN